MLQATARIGSARFSTYKEMAERSGQPARGSAPPATPLGSNPIPVVVPCHRVLRTGGKLGGYTGGLDKKEYLLTLEGVLAG